MKPDADLATLSTVDELNAAIRLYRRLVLRTLLIVFGGFVVDLVLVKIGTMLSPPYGVYILGEGLGTWGLLAIVVLLFAEIWIDGRAIGKILNDPILKTMPAVGVMSAMTVIGQRAHAMGMRSTGFLGPLVPAKLR